MQSGQRHGVVWRRTCWLALAITACGGRDVDWNRKDAWSACPQTIDRWSTGDPTPPCSAMHMCANEAVLSDVQQRKLSTMMAAATPSCAAP